MFQETTAAANAIIIVASHLCLSTKIIENIVISSILFYSNYTFSEQEMKIF